MACQLDTLKVGQLIECELLGNLCEACGYVCTRHLLGKYEGMIIKDGTPTHVFLSLNNYVCPGCNGRPSYVYCPCGGITHEAFKEVVHEESEVEKVPPVGT